MIKTFSVGTVPEIVNRFKSTSKTRSDWQCKVFNSIKFQDQCSCNMCKKNKELLGDNTIEHNAGSVNFDQTYNPYSGYE